jgi:hypothetical protein
MNKAVLSNVKKIFVTNVATGAALSPLIWKYTVIRALTEPFYQSFTKIVISIKLKRNNYSKFDF